MVLLSLSRIYIRRTNSTNLFEVVESSSTVQVKIIKKADVIAKMELY
ncbi:hypothetical protein COMA2_320002 [Candidatus Nitrospira nitrificans]|uniref:Uncharacterized protein n=1 Tax=Candidatus Nitrospira nitrificans TaxID=1742973 RepID=A0A0S4LK94_9BACT|nr:hypothetical protein COMA2_320002 [Candidatus Nitrospira nitrificans]